MRAAKAALWISLFVFVFGTLFPFEFDFSSAWLTESVWRARYHRAVMEQKTTDILVNVAATIPIGFFGLLSTRNDRRRRIPWTWGVAGLGIGVAAECLQLALPVRVTSVADALHNGLGAFIGAWAAQLIRSHLRK